MGKNCFIEKERGKSKGKVKVIINFFLQRILFHFVIYKMTIIIRNLIASNYPISTVKIPCVMQL